MPFLLPCTLITMAPDIHLGGITYVLDCIIPQNICLGVWDPSLYVAFLPKVMTCFNQENVSGGDSGDVAQLCEYTKSFEFYTSNELYGMWIILNKSVINIQYNKNTKIQ